ncbi:MAG TPA: hypothetical protein VJR70_06750 [Stellaceae bacterium]|nr:hypothetical protein [Stellaceae bacterium]
MRRFDGRALPGLLLLAACSSAPAGTSTLIINDPYWDRVNVEIVVTRRADCDSRGEGFVSTKQLVMRKNATERFAVPNGATLCWRHDRDPNNPQAGAWSGWTRATVQPGQEAETDL